MESALANYRDKQDDSKIVVKRMPQSAARSMSEQPGGLRSETRMTIQTRQAQKIVVGRRAGKGVQAIVGLLTFGRRMKLLWLSAQGDDPYADWYLLKIEESINEAKQLIQDKKQWLDQVLSSMDSFDLGVAQSLEPVQVLIVFQNPYGYMGAYLVADYDALCCSVFTASHVGLIDRKTANDIIDSAGKAIRRTFDLVTKWKFVGVTRDDIKANNPAATRAIEQLGECPEPVLKGDRRARISPEIRKAVPRKQPEADAENADKAEGETKSPLKGTLTLAKNRKASAGSDLLGFSSDSE